MQLGLDLLFLVPGETGGRETYARELIRAMLAAEPGLDVTAFVGRDGGACWARELGASLRIVTLPVSARRADWWATGELALLPVAARRTRVDLLHSMANFAPVGGPFARVVTLHDLQYRAVPELLPPARRAGTAALVTAAARRTHRVITVSAFSRDAIVRDLGVASDRVDVIPNGVVRDDRGRMPSEADLRDRLGIGARPLVLTVAAALPHKNLNRLLDAMALIVPGRRPVLALVGLRTDGPHSAGAVDRLSLSDDVRLLGFQPAPTLDRLYAMSAGVVVPSLYEGFGLPAIEAMARGVPVACSDIPPLREVAGNAALFFSPDRTEAIAEAILALLRDRSAAIRRAAAGRDRAALFSWDRAARATLASYRRALASASR